MAKEWRSRNLVHRSTSHPRGERDLALKSKDSAGRREAKDGEAYALVFQGKGQGFSRSGVLPFFCP